MAGNFRSSNNDSMDISELAALNEDFSDDFLEELQNKLISGETPVSDDVPANENDDSTLFEEPVPEQNFNPEPTEATVDIPVINDAAVDIPVAAEEKKEEVQVNQSFDDNFIKKYKAKLNKKAQDALDSGKSVSGEATTKYMQENIPEPESESIESLTNGNISEHPLTQDIKDYNESLDFLDGNVKYSKYVIYIDPKNVDFIDGLTVKERKNLINGILRQQDDVSITKQRFALIQTILRQVIIAVLTLSISIPLVYYVINISLEATVDNYRRSQTNWQVLYKQHGKIQNLNK